PAQVAVAALRDLHQMVVTVSDLTDGAGHTIAAADISIRMVRYYGTRLAVRVANRFGVVPKTLEVAVPIEIPAATTRPYWITVHVPKEQPGGMYRGVVVFAHTTGETTVGLNVEVLPLSLDEPDCIYGTLCLNALGALAKPRLRNAGTIRRN